MEKIANPSGQAKTTAKADDYDTDYSARLKRFHDSNDTTLDYYDEYYEGRTMPGESSKKDKSSSSTSVSTNVSFGLGFGNPYFGSSWSFGFGYPYSGWGLGFGFGWGYPSYGWGYYPPYWGYYPPYYGYYPPYYGYYPPYYGYYPPYYPVYPGYPDVGYRPSVYQPRMSRAGGSSIPSRGTVAGGSGVYSSPKGKPSSRPGMAATGKRVPINPEGPKGKIAKPEGSGSRPAGSMRYNAALAKKHGEVVHNQGRLNKPNGGSSVRKSYEGKRNPAFGISGPRNKGAESYRKPPAFRREESMPKPRFEKPKQYRSLESRSPRSSKEFYRTPARPVRSEYGNASVSTVRTRPQPARVQNVFRPSGSRNGVYRSRPVRSGVKVYNAPDRIFSSPSIFRGPVRRGSSGSNRPSRSFSAPSHNFSVPVRINTSGSGSRSSGSGGGSVRRGSSGSGGIKR